jgi:hypothetical protein
MSSAAHSVTLAEVGGEALLRTNPVLYIDRLLGHWDQSDASWALIPARLRALLETLEQHGIRVPREAVNRWVAAGHLSPRTTTPGGDESPEPRVIGLAVHGRSETGYVLPLRPTRVDDSWHIEPTFPFTPEELQDGLASLLPASRIANSHAVPERLAFRFENPTRLTARGDSMTVAAILAVLDRMSGCRVPLLRAAVAVVEIGPNGTLCCVADVAMKLAAARRECGPLSLIVRHPDTPDADIAARPGEHVWSVASVEQLARELQAAGLLAPLFAEVGPLAHREAARVIDRLRGLVGREHRYCDAADLGDRVRQCGFGHPPDPAAWVDFARLHATACRHNGRYGEAATVSREAHSRVSALGDLGSDDEEADAAAELAASLFSGHRFDDIPRLLEPWAAAARHEPRRFRSLTRVKVWNTLGRTMAVLGRDGWDDLFDCSLSLLRTLDDAENIDRTTHYRVHARLRHGDTHGARAALGTTGSDGVQRGNTWVAFYRAKLAQLDNAEWVDEVLEQRLIAGSRPYSVWLYVQATARQPKRVLEEALRRLEVAIRLLREEAGGVQRNVCTLFAAFLELNAAARRNDPGSWTLAVQNVSTFLSTAPDHRAYYGHLAANLPHNPDLKAAEQLLDQVPYF